MAKEIERKFLVKDTSYRRLAQRHTEIRQAYLSDNPDATVRLRIRGDKAYLTVKSRNNGIERGEWEYEIPVSDAVEMMGQCRCTDAIEKTRWEVGRWEVDEFHGTLEGLAIAEIELDNSEEAIVIPEFIGREVTGDPRYYNSVLASTGAIPDGDPTD